MNWYFPSGDIGFFWGEQIRAFSWLPQVFQRDMGFGFNGLLSLWLDYPFRLIVKSLFTLGLSWFVIEKALWLFVFALAIYSSYKLAKNLIAPVIYTANTYLLLLFNGGQLGVALAYAYAPFIFYRFMKYEKPNVREQIINGLCLALLITFDLRIAFLVVLATIYWWRKSIGSLFVAASVHMFWIVPALLSSRGTATLGNEFTNPGMLKYLSFADFSHSLAFLHPNWPENLFGKVYFLQPEFLVIPIVAFSALIFSPRKIRFFAILALVGVFFAKGIQDPFGGLFAWMFEHVPGFVMFRDPTKFYIYIAIGYSVLISYTLARINKRIVYALFILFWIFTLRAMSVRVADIPQEYINLKNILISDRVPSRTLWIPQKEGFAFSSEAHPILEATTAASIDPSVKYVIVPIDVNKRIFMNDYKYDPRVRQKIIEELSHAQLQQDTRFRELAVFDNPGFSGMHVSVPANVGRQQQLANIGLGISVVFLFFWTIWIYLH